MKTNIKISLFAAVAAIALTIGSSAFKNKNEEIPKKHAGPFYWVMINAADETSGTARVDKTKYVKAGGTGTSPVTCVGMPQRMCQLHLEDDGNTIDPRPNIPTSTTDPLYIKLYNSNNSAPEPQPTVIFAKQN